jgi:hypothetical protein
MEFQMFPKMGRYSRDVIVTEKIDGTNAQIFIGEDGEFLVGSRKRWITPENDNFGFAKWAYENEEELMELGPGRHFGEWWGSGIQRGYGLEKGEKRFSLFNTSRWSDNRPMCCRIVPVLWEGKMDDLNVRGIMAQLAYDGSHASPGFKNPEGIVIFHTHANVGLKKTFEKDSTGKWDK